MKGIVIFKGKYGATAQYATWLGEALYLPVVDIDQQSTIDLAKYTDIFVGSPVYMGKLLARDWLRKNTAILQDKKATLFVVCANTEKEKNKRDNMMEKNVPGIVGKTCGIFFLPGRVVINQLSWFDRLVVKIGAFFEEDPAKKALMLHGFDCVKRENINDLIKSALNYSNPEKVPV